MFWVLQRMYWLI